MIILKVALCCVTVVVFLYLTRFIRWYRKFRKCVNEYPGRSANFLLGDVAHLSWKRDQLFLDVRELAKEFPLGYRLWSGLIGSFNFIKAADFELILSNPKYINKESVYIFFMDWLGQSLLTSAGSHWHQRRKLLTPAFHFNVLRRFVRIFGEHCDSFVEELKEECNKEKTNIVPMISRLTLDLICETAMGIKLQRNSEKEVKYCQAIYKMGHLMVERALKPWYHVNWLYRLFPTGREYFKNIKILHQFTSEVIRERERTFQDSDVEHLDEDVDESVYSKKKFAMLDLLISAKRTTGEIDDIGIREEVDTFMFEGHDTTSMAITYTLLCLANYKDIQERVRLELNEIFHDSTRTADSQDLQRMTYLNMVIKETLRLYPSVPFISRTLLEDVSLREGKYLMPRLVFVHMHIYDLHRDPEIFPNPEKFDPDRFLPENITSRNPYSYVPFSAGPRNCIGQRYAMLEIKSVISSILRNFEIQPVDTPENIRMMIDLVLRPVNGIHVKFVPLGKCCH